MPFLYYRELEDMIRRDLYDGKQVYHPEGNEDSLFINGNKINYLPGLKIENYDRDDEYWAISCFSKSNSLTKFGEICVKIHDRDEFVQRIKTFFANKYHPKIVCEDITYYDPKLSQKIINPTFLYKTKEFGEEEEFRICINFKELLKLNQIPKMEVVNINLGNLKDISSIKFNN